MRPSFYRFLASAVVALSLFAFVGFGVSGANIAQASSLTTTQVSAIIGLLQSFGADQNTINNVSAALGGSTTNGGLSCTSFSDVTYGQFDNAPDGRVSQLQTWLGISPTTFGFGTYGNKTRALWNAQCGGAMTPIVTQPTTNTLSATPTSGAAPLTVTFVFPGSAGGDYVGFGDGTDACSISGAARDVEMGTCSAPSGVPVTHTYTLPGTYHVSVSRNLPSTILGTATITVTGGSTSAAPSATILPGSLSAFSLASGGTPTIAGTASGVSNVHVVVTSQANPSLQYPSGSIAVSGQGTWAWAMSTPPSVAGNYIVNVYSGTGYISQGVTDGGTLLASSVFTVISTVSTNITEAEMQSIVTLLQSFGANATTQNAVEAALNGQSVGTMPVSVTSTQAQTIVTLLQQWGISQTTINAVAKVLAGLPTN